jgi:magnesium transporter
MLATSYPSAILARERSIIVNLEFIKMIVGMDCCYITNLDDPNTTQFVEELQHRLKYGPTQTGEESAPALYGHQSHDDMYVVGLSSKVGPVPKTGSNIGSGGLARARSYSVLPPLNPLPELPFELRVLETALDYISKYLEDQASDLEAAAHPALDSLTQKINTASLERVRRVKNRMVRLNTRVETVRFSFLFISSPYEFVNIQVDVCFFFSAAQGSS